ncbi:MAG: BlaI/MecI/CopY family transcriptional regulator [Actinomycetota bacterium]|nr:BlaI/MecI/CopY family transcriptional regulator [Actinomycetota bacterium]
MVAKYQPVPPALHELESEVMQELWASGETSVRTVMEALNRGATKARAYTTYMTVMARLHRKGLLDRRREGKTDFYRPVLSREEYLERRAGTEVEALVHEYGDLALTHFARQMSQIDPKRLRALQRLAGKH